MKIDRKTIIALVLVVLAIGVVVYQFLPKGSRPRPTTGAPAEAASVASPVAVVAQKTAAAAETGRSASPYGEYIETVKENDLAFEDNTRRNPMTPLIKDAKDAAGSSEMGGDTVGGEINALTVGYTIEGIVWNQAKPLALVNNQVVTTGEKLDDGSLITEITSDTVRFTKDGKMYFLVFREDR